MYRISSVSPLEILIRFLWGTKQPRMIKLICLVCLKGRAHSTKVSQSKILPHNSGNNLSLNLKWLTTMITFSYVSCWYIILIKYLPNWAVCDSTWNVCVSTENLHWYKLYHRVWLHSSKHIVVFVWLLCWWRYLNMFGSARLIINFTNE